MDGEVSMNLQNDKYGIKAFNHKNILIVVGFVGLLTITCSILPRQGEGEKRVSTSQMHNSTQIVSTITEPDINDDVTSWIDEDILYYDLITGLYHLYDTDVLGPLVLYTITNNGPKDLNMIAQSEVLGFTDVAVNTINVSAKGKSHFSQTPVLLSEAIDKLMNSKNSSIRIQVSVLENGEEKKVLDETDPLTVYARRDFPWAIEGLSMNQAKELIASWVKPNDPKVEELLRDAANYMPDGVMYGGYTEDVFDVWDRLESIWKAMDDVYDITYVSTLVSFEPGDVQRIRLPAEVIEQKSGNCIELTLLMASTAEAIRLHPYVVMVPGHAFLAVDTVEDGSRAYFIETTLIGRSSFGSAERRGGEEWDEVQQMVEDPENDDYDIIDIYAARAKGILPIPWR